MLLIAALAVASTVAGAASGALGAWLLLRRRQRESEARPVPLADPERIEEIERAAEAWAKSQGRPEATPLMADKLHLLHDLGQRRGWWR
jgi:hypothetical protein